MTDRRALPARVPRWVLALLAVVASVVFVTRDPGPGVPAPPVPRPSALHAGHPVPYAPAPSAPAGHDHGAHCPFCFTAAFALAADRPPAPARPALHPARTGLQPVHAVPAAARSADARAPPPA